MRLGYLVTRQLHSVEICGNWFFDSHSRIAILIPFLVSTYTMSIPIYMGFP